MPQFLLEENEYKRDLNLVSAYHRDTALYLARQTQQPYEKCLAYVEQHTAPGGKLAIKDPEVLLLSKETPGNRTRMVMTFTEYLKDVEEKENLISPTMAVYTNPKVKRSLLSRYISDNIQKRNRAKDEMFEATVAGDDELATFKDIEQSSFKIKNNSLSGAHASPYTILYNKSSHSTLTSTCRTATSYGNANNEKFLCGNRHYWAPDVVKANIVSIVNNTDMELLQQALDSYGIRHPTVEETMDCITYSTDLYWRNPKELKVIERLVNNLSPLERSAFVYIGDLYHLAKYNDSVVREFLDLMSTPATEPIENPDVYIDAMDSDTSALVRYLCVDEINKRHMNVVKTEDPVAWGIVGATVKHIQETVDRYALLIKALWITTNVPASVASIPTIIRRGAVASDTDSTIFTVQHWTEWFVGQLDFSKKSNAVRDVMAFLSSKLIKHILALMSTQMGVIKEQRYQLSMKNEYTFPLFTLTSRSKHYFAFMSAQEGNVYQDYRLELKGVALRNSNSPTHIREGSRQLIMDIMQGVIDGKGISSNEVLARVAAIEKDIRDSILSGDYSYFKTGQVKTMDSYRNPESSPYVHYLLWEEVFASKYGHSEPPTYAAIKVSIEADNATKLKAWLERIEDRSIADKLEQWLVKNKRNYITTMILPESVVRVTGVPKEIIAGIDIRKLISDTMEPFYLVLESIGIYMKDNNLTKLVSDYYS